MAEKDVILDIKQPKEQTPSISFFTLFRFSTPLERFLNILGLLAAAAAGTAQPLLALIFGNLTQSFVLFGTAIQQQLSNPSTDSIEQVRNAAGSFRHAAARDSLILVLIGESRSLLYVYMLNDHDRCWHVRLYMVLYVHMGLDGRTKR